MWFPFRRPPPPKANIVHTSIKPVPPINPGRCIPSQPQRTLTPDWSHPREGLMWRRWDDFRLWNCHATWEEFIRHLEAGNNSLRGEIASLEHQLTELTAKRGFKP